MYFSSFFNICYVEAEEVDRGIDIEIAIDRVAKENPFQDRQVRIRWKTTEKICRKLKSNEKTHRNRKTLYLWCQLKPSRKQYKSHIYI